MYYKKVTLWLDDVVKCTVNVPCSPKTPDSELREIALKILQARLKGEPHD